MNSGQFLSQLACVSVLQEAQCLFSGFVQLMVRWSSPHVPQVSMGSGQLAAKCPQRLHRRHWSGSCLSFSDLTLAPQISNPVLMMLFAVSTPKMMIVACAC